MSTKVLFVDDEEHILNSLERLFADTGMHILRAGSAVEALPLFELHEIAVVVADNMMPGMRGVELFCRLKDIAPKTVKILMTAYADLPTALEAINRGEVYRFVVKPWDNEELTAIVGQSVHRYLTLSALAREDEAVLQGLAQTIELKDPYTRGHCARVSSYALMIAEELLLSSQMRKDIRYGSWLHDCGKIGVPETILNFSGPVAAHEFDTIKKHPIWGAEVARQAQLPPTVVDIVLYHHERFDGDGYPQGLAGEEIPLAARIVSVADVYDALTTERPYRRAYTWQKGIDILLSMRGNNLDPALVDCFVAALKKRKLLPNDCVGGEQTHE
ncbi:HD-GYP domain-containing protein [Geobacter sulfurreducens]|uniref:HD-GYP domain-containing protein n=1 Tax=Geobacter sulfurreducens TaxID=35554 RepID=UPI000DBB6AA1|nr:HD domain-containing phosphohydrolase [Geobacter sulfurreducens]BBA70594.1 Cyclic di-GMP phosphodiesterase response regulator RpfG [Geobacter sulfurreducens]